MICYSAPEKPCIAATDSRLWRIDMQSQLQADELVSSVVVAGNSPEITPTNASPTTAEYVDRGITVPAGKGAQVEVTNPTDAPGTYYVDLDVSTVGTVNQTIRVRMYCEMTL